ncbi:MAG: cold shock domain-containing protein [Bacteroidia bacterium]|nr:cold shock domain-containing protein [Bacteroidia bacterium]MBT8267578.1 cold shock domain-containing protein [Bacteroidia bacterium]
MSKSQQTFNKREREKKKQKKRKEKLERRQQRKLEAKRDGNNLDEMMMYVDENGNFTRTPPDPKKKEAIKLEDINVSTPKMADRADETSVRKGIVKFFNEEKGYGFITDTKNQDNIFVHISQLEEPLKQQNKVSFEIEMGPKGKTAVNVVLIRE